MSTVRLPVDEDADRTLLLELFKHRCGNCLVERATCVHEIIPMGISSKKDSMHISNRIPICDACHRAAHENTKLSIPLLQQARERAIVFFGIPRDRVMGYDSEQEPGKIDDRGRDC